MDLRPVPGQGDLIRAPMPHGEPMLDGHSNQLGMIYHDAMWSWEKAAIRAQNLKRAKQAARSAQVIHDRPMLRPSPGPLSGLSRGMLTENRPIPPSVMIGGPLPPGMKFPMPKLPYG